MRDDEIAPDTLDAAFADAVDALPPGWEIDFWMVDGGYAAQAGEPTRFASVFAGGESSTKFSTGPEALRSLAAALRAQPLAADGKRDGLLPPDYSEIAVVPDAVRRVWEPQPPKRTERQKKALREAAAEAVAGYRKRRSEDKP